jgi:ATP-dependent Clp protease protease subunit
MRKDLMPQARQFERPQGLQWDVSPQALERWSANLMRLPRRRQENTISIFDPIGVDFWTGEGVTAKRVAGALRGIGADKDVSVNINSPGGDLFEGLAIYNLLREHKGTVTVKVLGLAASAASIIAMAGDEIQIARAGFFMVHNTWVIAIGNRNDLRDIADTLEPFDVAMADIYTARTGLDPKAVQKKMDAETWINGSAAVDEGWADALLPSDEVRTDKSARRNARRLLLDRALAKAGMPRSERRALLQDFKASTPSAAGRETGKPCATEDGKPSAADAGDFLKSIKLPEIQI